ncbi:PhoX family protein [Klebsiella pneumoniae]|uniref:PhoX family protein n=1 Tax=Klebsiella pneumoniae TaxID=573 RepID=UPI000459C779|nr:PhoX family phosphatase [Klebsiella pneumoniae]AIW71907.1 Tat pathway signal protein [Klebsiella pneumoniae subsp. pneumoniae]AUA50539.1 PhoX family phosphatase [Klebsiella pneumoniae]EIV9692878.1 PhoX family phosphatase [Klebsiella pneumoniae]EIV9705190.1 PhoX family phosphatase [Klebsiella pneumoniae]EIV9832211.1 PhoX family phosphatase [Klebsiella pneumoniae]
MSSPLKSVFKKEHSDEISNHSVNPVFSEVVSAFMSRRRFLQMGMVAGAAVSFPYLVKPENAFAAKANPSALSKAVSLGFTSIPVSTADTVTVPEGYIARPFYRWGDAVGIKGNLPEFKFDASNTTDEQAAQAGMHHDGMAWFSLPQGKENPAHGLLALNHEYIDNGMLFKDGTANWDLDKARKGQNAMGISVIEVKKDNVGWQVVRPSSFARRITVNTPMQLSGPARHQALMKTAADPQGEVVLGTMQNCANGKTPWGTYLTCEENWSDIFVKKAPRNVLEKRYGISDSDESYHWNEVDERFSVDKTPNEPNRFGWVVEIDPYDPTSTPRKHTALGRFKHEGAAVTLAGDNRVVVYMGDDQKFEYIYKFISENKYDPGDRKANMQLLESGTLYVARFNDDGSGDWLPLIFGENGLDQSKGFDNQGDLLIKTRLAADTVGATKMDRPEWIAVDTHAKGSVYCTLTNNSDRGKEGKAPVDAANPRANNQFGHIMHWREERADPASAKFTWNILVLAGRTDSDDPKAKGSMQGAEFGSPDGLSFDHRGVLWIQTDVSSSTINKKAYEGMGNNQMIATLPGTNEYRRFLTGPRGCEITGIAFTPDNRTLFINIQHPGEGGDDITDPSNPRAISNWPDSRSDGRPRSSTVVITKSNGGIIGT